MNNQQIFIVTEYWTNSSNNGGNTTTIYNNYEEALKHFNQLKDKIYDDYNPIIIRFKDGKYDYHKNEGRYETGYTDDFIIQNFKEDTIYERLCEAEGNQFLIHTIYTKGDYQEHILSQEGYYKRTRGADLKIMNISKQYKEKNENSMTSCFIPQYKTY